MKSRIELLQGTKQVGPMFCSPQRMWERKAAWVVGVNEWTHLCGVFIVALKVRQAMFLRVTILYTFTSRGMRRQGQKRRRPRSSNSSRVGLT